MSAQGYPRYPLLLHVEYHITRFATYTVQEKGDERKVSQAAKTKHRSAVRGKTIDFHPRGFTSNIDGVTSLHHLLRNGYLATTSNQVWAWPRVKGTWRKQQRRTKSSEQVALVCHSQYLENSAWSYNPHTPSSFSPNQLLYLDILRGRTILAHVTSPTLLPHHTNHIWKSFVTVSP
ncbi:unnamed protein product [Ectocarpus sp. 4 AP-2014]